MSLPATTLDQLLERACAAARAAGARIIEAPPQKIERKQAGSSLASQLVTEVDRASEELIVQHLAPSLEAHGLALLSEERDDDRERLRSDAFWCIDPLDGTLPFVEGRHGFSVSIALVSREGRPMLGVVYDPVENTLYAARRGAGLRINGRPWAAPEPASTLSVFADRSFADSREYPQLLQGLEAIADEHGLEGQTLKIGAGAAMNACQALVNPPALYFKLPKSQPGGGSCWDFAAAACIYSEAGGIACDMQGAALDLNPRESTFMNRGGVVFATSDALAASVQALGARLRSPAPSGSS